MLYDVVLQEEAIDDIQIAFEWYEEQKTGLGYTFLDEINVCLEKLSTHPLHYGLLNKWVRRIATNKFPFLIVFEIEDSTVYINAVRHESRKPKY